MSLSVRFQHRFPDLALKIDFDAPGGVTALFGPSGCGKSTTANAIAGLMHPDLGRIELDGRVLFDKSQGVDLSPQDRHIGFVFQDSRLFPHMTVAKNLRYSSRFRKGATRDFDRIIDMLALGPLLKRHPTMLSGGERQRTAIGRALLSNPQLLIMDEPLAALDQSRKDEIMPWLERLRDEAGLPIIYVSHSVSEVLRLATTIVMLERGHVLHAGRADAVLSDARWAATLGQREAGALITGQIIGRDKDGMTRVATQAGSLLLPDVPSDAGKILRLRIFAHEVILAREAPSGLSALNILPAIVTQIQGGHVQLKLGDELMLAQITPRSVEALDLRPGSPCHAIIKSVSVLQA